MEDELLTVQQVAAQFQVSRQAVMYWINKGYLPARRPQTPVGIRAIWLVAKVEADQFAPPRRRRTQGDGLTV